MGGGAQEACWRLQGLVGMHCNRRLLHWVTPNADN